MDTSRVCLILNPRARRAGEGAAADEISARLAARGVRCDVRRVDAPGDGADAAAQAAAAGLGRVVVAAGDGTIGEVAGALCGTQTAMAIVPLGTGNALARELCIPLRDIDAACDVALRGAPRAIDLGLCSGVPFAAMCGVGLDAEVAHRTELGDLKGPLGVWAFVGDFLALAARRRPHRMCAVVDGRVIETDAWAAVVCNGATYSWRLSFVPSARADDGLLHLVLFEQTRSLQLVLDVARHWASAGALPVPRTRHFAGRRIEIEAEVPVRWQVDGNPMGVTPVDIKLIPNSVRIVVPSGPHGGAT